MKEFIRLNRNVSLFLLFLLSWHNDDDENIFIDIFINSISHTMDIKCVVVVGGKNPIHFFSVKFVIILAMKQFWTCVLRDEYDCVHCLIAETLISILFRFMTPFPMANWNSGQISDWRINMIKLQYSVIIIISHFRWCVECLWWTVNIKLLLKQQFKLNRE